MYTDTSGEIHGTTWYRAQTGCAASVNELLGFLELAHNFKLRSLFAPTYAEWGVIVEEMEALMVETSVMAACA